MAGKGRLTGFSLLCIVFIVNTGCSAPPVKYFDEPEIAEYKPRCKPDSTSCGCRTISYSMKVRNDSDLFRGMQRLPGLWKEYEKELEKFNESSGDLLKYSFENKGCEILLTQMMVKKMHPKIKLRFIKEKNRYKVNGNIEQYS